MSGNVTVTTDVIRVTDLSCTVRGITFVVNGTIKDYLSAPQYSFTVMVKNYHFTDAITLKGSFTDQTFTASFHAFDRYFSVKGRYRFEDGRIRIYDARAGDTYAVSAFISLADDIYECSLSNDTKEINLQYQYQRGNPTLHVDCNHINFFGFDLVVKGVIDLRMKHAHAGHLPVSAVTCSLRTEYVIFNYLPLHDFHGSFDLNEKGIDNIDFLWGTVYQLNGSLACDERFSTDLHLHVDDFALDELTQFMIHPLPVRIAGRMNADVTIEDSAYNPRIAGHVLIRDGDFGKFSFDHAEADFEGNKYELTIVDSRIVKNNRLFHAKGSIDFTKHNIFSNLSIQTSERLVIWRGWDVGPSEDGTEVLLKKKISDNVMLNAATGRTKDDTNDSSLDSSVKLEYDLGGVSTLSLEANDNEKGESVNLRHKIRF